MIAPLLISALLGVQPSLDSFFIAALRADCELWGGWSVRSGLLEESERGRFFYRYENVSIEGLRELFETDRDCILRRAQEMEPDCPTLDHVHRLLPKDDCWNYRWLVSKYIDQLERHRPWATLGEQDVIDREIELARWKYKLYDLHLDVIHNYGSRGRRLLLQDLRTHVGRQLYESGDWPQPLTPNGFNLNWIPDR